MGVLGGIGECFDAATGVGQLWARIEDGAQSFAGSVLNAAKTKELNNTKVEKANIIIDKDPDGYKESLELALTNQWLEVLRYFEKLQKLLLEADPAKTQDVDWETEQASIDLQLASHEFTKQRDPLPEMHVVADDLETWMWAKWIKDELFYTEHVSLMEGGGADVTKTKPLTSALKSRFIHLGIDKDSGIDQFSDWLSWESIVGNDEEQKLLEWANEFLEHINNKKIWRGGSERKLHDM